MTTLIVPGVSGADRTGEMSRPEEDLPSIAPAALDALLDLARSASEDPPERVLDTVAQTILATAGFRTVVLNVFRPVWDDFEATIVAGSQECRRTLLGTTTPRPVLEQLLREAAQRLPSVYFLTESSASWASLEQSFVPDLPASDAEGAWQAEDGLLITLSDSDGEPLGFASMDEPRSGFRPGDGDLRLLSIICSFAEQALRAARRMERSERDRHLLARLGQLSPLISACGSSAELCELVTDTIVDQFGFARVAIYTPGSGGFLTLRAHRGWGPDGPVPGVLAPSCAPTPEEICDGAPSGLLLEQPLLTPGRPDPPSSQTDGLSHRAWRRHQLLLPWGSRRSSQSGLIVLDRPHDRLLLTEDQRRTIRLLIDLAASVQDGIEHRLRLDRLASHDVLTGVRNRRDLDHLIQGHEQVALLLCDLDCFKQVNDDHGHPVGDQVLACFGDLLREVSREDDVAIRLGGEEFCLVLPLTSPAGAVAAAERLRQATAQQTASVIPGGITVSIGVACSPRRPIDARAMLAAADRALYRAKHAGRNRVVLDEMADGV